MTQTQCKDAEENQHQHATVGNLEIAEELRRASREPLHDPERMGHHQREPAIRSRELVRRFVVSPAWIAIQTAACILDACFPMMRANGRDVAHMQFMVAIGFLIDVVLRIFALGVVYYFQKPSYVFDAIVVALSVCFSLFSYEVARSNFTVLLVFMRLLRIVRVLRMMTKTVFSCEVCMRRIVGSHKARFVDSEHDFDLDLAYITPQLIAMGVPSTNCIHSLYRNPMAEVRHFFEFFHGGHYMIVNLCPELPYMASEFPSGKVVCYDIQDHSPPDVWQILHFLTLAHEWYAADPRNVIGIHCKGGKGRTGTYCAIWLLYAEEAESANAAADHFAERRTDFDPRTGSLDAKIQGVETPSQVRFLEAMEQLLKEQNQVRRPNPVSAPPPQPVLLQELVLEDFFRTPVQEELIVIVHRGARVIHWTKPSIATAAAGDWKGIGGCCTWDLSQCAALVGYGRISVAKKGAALGKARQIWEAPSGIKAGDEPGCLFFFIFHTSFLGGIEPSTLLLTAKMVDKAAKLTKRLYHPDGRLTLRFSREGSPARPGMSFDVEAHDIPLATPDEA